ncbi:hypothetical protein BKA70DRAFT_201901 [Coprinopsis sp. MPI-PUGE-AT-0042]|nr:hypothetical protein BKA70DRAFT_201901 [Coprinopsis sp. MPI-PUGE-AT-0042]
MVARLAVGCRSSLIADFPFALVQLQLFLDFRISRFLPIPLFFFRSSLVFDLVGPLIDPSIYMHLRTSVDPRILIPVNTIPPTRHISHFKTGPYSYPLNLIHTHMPRFKPYLCLCLMLCLCTLCSPSSWLCYSDILLFIYLVATTFQLYSTPSARSTRI